MRDFLLTAGGLGHMRPASGTWGSTPPPALALLLVWLTDANHLVVNIALVVMGALFAWSCVAFGRHAEQRWGKKDPGQVVADEVAGQCIALLALPWVPMTDTNSLVRNVAMAAAAFLLFRIFDIIKPPPASGLQRLPAGWGILVDDLFAGAYALIVVQIGVRLVG